MSRNTKNEQLLREIGDALRMEDVLDDPLWEKMAAGELSSEEHRQLEEFQSDSFDKEELQDAFSPMDDEVHHK